MMDKVRYAANEIRKNGTDRDWWHQRVEVRLVGPILRRIHGTDGIDVMAADWDTLLILDACRADMFEETIGTEEFDEYRRVRSKGCSSPEWMRENFAGRAFGDTVYVTANPWISKVAPDAFHDVVNIWTEEERLESASLRGAERLSDLGVSPGSTITPDRVNDAVAEAASTYPNKRLIVHYFQPHAPCIGRPDGTRKDDAEIDIDLHPGDTLKRGVVSHSEVWTAYEDNLEYVYHHAESLAAELDGRTVISADHAELFGEWLWPFPIRGYGHPSGVRHPKLTTVPWAMIDAEERRRIVDDGVTAHEADEEAVDERLRNLGYRV